jgi:hypothetical protein
VGREGEEKTRPRVTQLREVRSIRSAAKLRLIISTQTRLRREQERNREEDALREPIRALGLRLDRLRAPGRSKGSPLVV